MIDHANPTGQRCMCEDWHTTALHQKSHICRCLGIGLPFGSARRTLNLGLGFRLSLHSCFRSRRRRWRSWGRPHTPWMAGGKGHQDPRVLIHLIPIVVFFGLMTRSWVYPIVLHFNQDSLNAGPSCSCQHPASCNSQSSAGPHCEMTWEREPVDRTWCKITNASDIANEFS